MARRQDVGVLAEPADAGALGGGAVVHGPVVDEYPRPHRPAGGIRERIDEPAEALLHDVMVVVAPRVTRYFSAWRWGTGRGVAGEVAHGEGDYGPGSRQQHFGVRRLADALLGVPGQAVHQPVAHTLDGGLLVAQERLRRRDADEVEAHLAGQRLYGQLNAGRWAVLGARRRFAHRPESMPHSVGLTQL